MKLFCFAGGFLFFSLFFIRTGQAQSCEASKSSCDFYACQESQFQCGSSGYLLRFGEKNCLKYLDHQDETSEALQTWLPKVRTCLQRYLKSHSYTDCADLEKQALNSHVECYVRTGFCELSGGDQFVVGLIAGTDALLPTSVSTGLKIRETCAQRRSIE